MRRLAELQYEAEQCNLLEPTYNVPYTKEELMDMLAQHYRMHDPTRSPLIRQIAVMLARDAWDLEENVLEGMLNKPELWIAEEKIDGMRAKIHIGAGINRIDTRHRSDVTYEYCEKTAHLPHLQQLRDPTPIMGTVLDGELVMPVDIINDGKTNTEGYLTSTTATLNSLPARAIELQAKFGLCKYYGFDVLFWHYNDVRSCPYEERYGILEKVKEVWPAIHLPIRCLSGLKAFYETLVAAGGEGIMLKRLDYPYESGKRSKGWYKRKKYREIDCFITGYVPGEGEFSGLVGALLVSVYDEYGNVHEIGAIQPGDFSFRKNISIPGSGELDPRMYNRVVEVHYQCRTKNNRMRHSVLYRFRPDKVAGQCILEGGKL